MRFITKPLPAIWPGGRRTPPHERTWGGFRAGYDNTIALLEYELERLDAEEPVTWFGGYEGHEIRLDGRPRAGARPRDPAVIIAFNSRQGPLQFASDAMATAERNLRAIALTLRELRTIERYGVTQGGNQYRGWTALPAAGESSMTTHEALAFLSVHANGVTSHEDVSAAYRAAAKRLNPDLPGADPDLWKRLQRAKTALGI